MSLYELPPDDTSIETVPPQTEPLFSKTFAVIGESKPLAYENFAIPGWIEFQKTLTDLIENVLKTSLPPRQAQELSDEVVSVLASYGERVFDHVNPPKPTDTGYLKLLHEYNRRYRRVGAVHVELGTWTAWSDQRVADFAAMDGLSEFVRLDMNPDFKPDVAAFVTEMPFKDNSIDRISSNSLFEHVAYPHEIIKESFRILRPGGMMYVNVPFVFTQHGCPHDYLRYVPEYFQHVCRDVGFEVVYSDVSSSSGLYYTLHNSLKAAIVSTNTTPEEATAMRTLHMLGLLLLAALSPFDRYFQGEGRNFSTSTECFAIKPGEYKNPERSQRNTSIPFVQRNLDILACPISKQELRLDGSELICDAANIRYAVRNGIPVFVEPNGDTSYPSQASLAMSRR